MRGLSQIDTTGTGIKQKNSNVFGFGNLVRACSKFL